MNRSIAWGAGAGVAVLLALGGWWALQPGAASDEAVAERAGMPGAAVATLPSTLPPPAAPTAQAPVAGNSPTPAAVRGAAPADSSRPRLEDIQAELKSLSAGGRTPQVAELDAVFEKLERYNGGSQMGGVDLQLVRRNLQAAARIQKLSEQMKPLAADPTPENVQKLQALVAEMREAQAGMDVKGLMAAASAMQNMQGAKP